jgi:uncharacterized membrane protein
MWKRKWFIPVVVVSVLLIGGVVGGAVVAQSDNTTNTEDLSQPADRYQALLDRVCAIYEEKTGVAIDSEQLKEALKQAGSEMRDEAIENWLQNLVNKGEITQEEADQYLEWWQSRPDVKLPLPGLDKLARVFRMRLGPCFVPDATPETGG